MYNALRSVVSVAKMQFYSTLLKLYQHLTTMAYLCYMCEEWKGDDNQWQCWCISTFFLREPDDIACYFDANGNVWFFQCRDCHEQVIQEERGTVD